MEIFMDEDVKKVMSFMLSAMPSAKLVPVAKGINDLALLMWGHYPREDIFPISLKADPILADDPHKQLNANG